jgi:multiple sugar transport system permease protein
MTATVTAPTGAPSVDRPVRAKRRKPLRSRAYKWFRAVVLILIVVVFVAPLIWMLIASFKTNVDIYDASKTIFFTPTLENYDNVLGRNN